MRVLLISHASVTRSNHRLPEELARMPDLQLELFAPEWWPEESREVPQEKTSDPAYQIHQAQIAYWRQPMPNLFLFRNRLASVLRRFQPDILDIQEEPFSLVMGQILGLRQLLAPSSRVTFYSFQNLVKWYPLPFRQIELWAYRTAPIACAATDDIAEVLRQKGYPGDIDISPPGVDPEVFQPQPEAAAALRQQWGLTPDQPLLGYLGRITPEKGIDDLIAALPLLPAEVRLVIIGGGDRGPIETRAQALGVAHRVVYTGPINRLQAPAYLSALTALVVPSRTTARWKEQFGRVIVEAAACQVPVIGSDSGAIPAVIGTGGLVVPEGHVRALAHAAQLLISQPALARHLGALGRARAQTTFSWQSVAAGRYAVYQRLIG